MNDAHSRFIKSHDGLKLHVREYGAPRPGQLPLVCLPGITRTAEDFEPLADALAQQRHILAVDYRGRGLSDYDANSANYSLPVELTDLITVLAACAATPATFLGTSRGGMLIMLLASLQPQVIAGAILNDIGPVIDPAGLKRIKTYVGKLPPPKSLAEGAATLRRFNPDFPALTDADWLAFAKRTWRQRNGTLELVYDPRLMDGLAAFDPDQPLPDMWPQFDAMPHTPLMVVRGANSDILSPATVAAMRARRSDLVSIEVPNQGHAPLLSEADMISRISDFLAQCDKIASSPSG